MNILIAVRYPIFCDGIKKILAAESGISIKDTAQSKDELISLSLKEQCIVILDFKLPDLNGINTIKSLIENYPDLDILILGEGEDPNIVKKILQAGVSGYICKNQNADELIKAIKKIHQGYIYLSDETINVLFNKTENRSESKILPIELTEREAEILFLICQEMTNREIANKLSISVRTVDAHRRNILQKTGAKNTAGLVKYAIKYQIYKLS